MTTVKMVLVFSGNFLQRLFFLHNEKKLDLVERLKPGFLYISLIFCCFREFFSRSFSSRKVRKMLNYDVNNQSTDTKNNK